MKKWVKIEDETPPYNTPIRVKAKPIGNPSAMEYHNKHWPDGIYEGELLECGSLCGFTPKTDPNVDDTAYFLNLEAWAYWEKEIFEPIESRWEILDIRRD